MTTLERKMYQQPVQFREDRPPVQPHQHGTVTGYLYGCKCGDCREASALAAREARERRRHNLTLINGRQVQAGLPPVGPGVHNYAAYINWSCRCDTCANDTTDRGRQYRDTGHYA